jgi:hypothetical protein
MTDPIELAQLFDVDVDDLAWGGPLITAHRLSRLQRRQALRPRRLRMRLTVAAETPPRQRCACQYGAAGAKPRPSRTRAGVAWLGDECGLDERPRKPSTPSASNRSIHLPTVFGVVLN